MSNTKLTTEFSAAPDYRLKFYALTFRDPKTEEPDLNGNYSHPRSLDRWYAEFKAAGKPMVISFNHLGMKDIDDPKRIIGWAEPEDVEIDEHGLLVHAQLDADNVDATTVWRLAKAGVLDTCSYTFVVHAERELDSGARMILDQDVYEAGPVREAANDQALILQAAEAEQAAEEEPVIIEEASRDAEARQADAVIAQLKLIELEHGIYE